MLHPASSGNSVSGFLNRAYSALYEFRQAGRLGCPHDYVFFKDEMEPLIVNIHGAVAHTGKQPQRGSLSSDRQIDLIRLRREMTDAIELEDYEQASQIRDQIREIEETESSKE